MGHKEVLRVNISEVIRHWQAGNSRCRIASGTGLSKDTVGRYISAAEALAMSREGPAPTEGQLSRLAAIGRSGPRQSAAPTEDQLAPWADQVYQWLTGDRLQVTRIRELLAERGCRVSYASLHRFVARRAGVGQSRDRPDGGERPRGGGGAGLRPAGPGSGPGDGPPPHGVGPDRGAGPLQAQFRLAHLQPEAGGRHRRTGGGLVLLRRHPQVPGHGQFRGGGGWCRRAAPPVHPQLPGMLPARRLHLRTGHGAPSQGQAPGGAGRPVRSGAFLQRRQLQRTGTLERGIGALVSRCRRAASARHHQASAPGCLPWLSSLAVFPGCLP